MTKLWLPIINLLYSNRHTAANCDNVGANLFISVFRFTKEKAKALLTN